MGHMHLHHFILAIDNLRQALTLQQCSHTVDLPQNAYANRPIPMHIFSMHTLSNI